MTLYWWVSRGDAREEALQTIAKQYTSIAGNSKIKVEVVERDPRTYLEDVEQALVSNQSVKNAPDIFTIDAEDLPKYAPQLAPAPDTLFNTSQVKAENTGKNAPESVKVLYEDVVGKSCILKDASGNDKLYGLPIALDPLALYVNTDLTQRAIDNIKKTNKNSNELSQTELSNIIKLIQTGPKTWTELAKIAPYLTIRDGNTITQSGLALGTSTNIERSYDILSSMMLQNGTEMTSSDMGAATFNQSIGQATSSTTPGLRALNVYTQFSDPQSSLYTWNSSMPNDVEAFEQGQVAMIFHYADLYRFLISEAPSLKSKINVMAMPQIVDPSSPVGSDTLKTAVRMNVQVAPSAKGDQARQRAAWNFIKYVTGKQGSAPYLSNLQLPSALKNVKGNSKFAAFASQKSWGDAWFKGHKSETIDQIFIAMIQNTADKKTSAKDALDNAAKDTSTILQAAKTKWSTSQ